MTVSSLCTLIGAIASSFSAAAMLSITKSILSTSSKKAVLRVESNVAEGTADAS